MELSGISAVMCFFLFAQPVGSPASTDVALATRPQKQAVPYLPHDEFSPCNSPRVVRSDTWGPREPLPGHGRRHHSHLAAGLGQSALYTVQHPPEDLKPATSIKRISSSNLVASQRRVPQASTTQHFGLFLSRHQTLLAPSASRNPAPARPAQRAARLAAWSRPGLVLQAPQRNAMPGGTSLVQT